MFTNCLVNNRPGTPSMLAGFAVSATAVLVLVLLPFLVLEKLTPRFRVTAITLAQPPQAKPLRVPRPLPPPVPANATASAAAKSAQPPDAPRPAPKPSGGPILAQPDTPAWTAHVHRGRQVAFDIYAVDSLPVIRALGVIVVFDTSRPRGEVLMFDLGKNAAYRARVPPNVVVREFLGAGSGIPSLDQARRQAEAELGAPPRLFTLWPADLYAVLKSTTEAALRQASIDPATVRAAHVQLQPAGNKSFTIRLTSTQRT